MKILSLKKVEHFRPCASSGTGYSEPDKFHVVYDTGRESDIWIDIWYEPLNNIRKEFNKHMPRGLENKEEAWEMYVSEIAETSCPYKKSELLNKK